MLEGVPCLADGQPGCSSDADDAPLPAILGFLLQHLHKGVQGVHVTGCGEPGACLNSVFNRRSIPACAGVSPCVTFGHLSQAGLSPRVRGNPDVGDLIVPVLRSIPACAGEPLLHTEQVQWLSVAESA